MTPVHRAPRRSTSTPAVPLDEFAGVDHAASVKTDDHAP